jgi:hypothetical protein
VPIRALITIRDPDTTVLEGPSTLVDVPVTSLGLQEPVVAASITNSPLEERSTTLATANPSVQETRLPEPTAVSSAAARSSEKVILPDSSFASPAVNVHPSEGTHLQEPTTSSSAITTSLSRRVCFTPKLFSPLSALPYSLAFLPGSEPFKTSCV